MTLIPPSIRSGALRVAVVVLALGVSWPGSAWGQDTTQTTQTQTTTTTPTQTTTTETTPVQPAPVENPAAQQYVESVPTAGGGRASKPGTERQSAPSQLGALTGPVTDSPEESDQSQGSEPGNSGERKRRKHRATVVRRSSPEGVTAPVRAPSVPASLTASPGGGGPSLAWLAAALALMTLISIGASYGSRRAHA
jgi:hypothetical protein